MYQPPQPPIPNPAVMQQPQLPVAEPAPPIKLPDPPDEKQTETPKVGSRDAPGG